MAPSIDRASEARLTCLARLELVREALDHFLVGEWIPTTEYLGALAGALQLAAQDAGLAGDLRDPHLEGLWENG